MKLPFFALVMISICSCGLAAEPFTAKLTPEEFQQAGLDRLSSEQRAKLDSMVSRYYGSEGSETVAVAKAEAERARQETATAREELTRQKAAREAAEKQVADVKKSPSPKSLEKLEPAAIEGRLVGTIRGWEEKTIFVVEGGQSWQVANYTRYTARHPVVNPSVSITKGVFGYTMDIDGIGTVRVRPLGK